MSARLATVHRALGAGVGRATLSPRLAHALRLVDAWGQIKAGGGDAAEVLAQIEDVATEFSADDLYLVQLAMRGAVAIYLRPAAAPGDRS